jgi:chromosome segregation ATPase
MATEAQMTANQANAQKSTGPRTEAGKQKSSQNARTLGLFISNNTLQQENPDDTLQLIADYTAEFAPVLPTHHTLLQQLVSATLRLRRLDQIEATLLSHEPGTGDLAQQFEANLKQLEALRRQRTAAERSFEKARKVLSDYRKVHPIRPGEPITLEIERPKPKPASPCKTNPTRSAPRTARSSSNSTPSTCPPNRKTNPTPGNRSPAPAPSTPTS